MLRFFMLTTAILLVPAAVSAQEAVRVPLGETSLCDIGIYQVSYRSGEADPVALPPSWSGHFDEQTGVSYVQSEHIAGRPAILLHCPWRIPSGPAWVDYKLVLPDEHPISLSFGVINRPADVAAGNGDGVTFACTIIGEDGVETELMRQHVYSDEWIDFDFDLSEHAGSTITLRLESGPGPAGNSSFDFAYFGSPTLAVGTASTSVADQLEALTSARAYQATRDVSLTRLANDPANGVTPGNLLPYANASSEDAGVFTFSYDAPDCSIEYRIAPTTGTLDDVTVLVDGDHELQPMIGGGVSAVQGDGAVPLRGGALVQAGLGDGVAPSEADVLHIRWQYETDAGSIVADWEFGIVGKALTVRAACEEPVLAALSLGHMGAAPLRRTLDVPYMPGIVDYLPSENLYACRYLDWTQSHGSRCPQGEVVYEPRTDGTRVPLQEVGYVAVSPQVGEVLPNIPHPPSPFKELLGPRIMLDIWGHYQGTYEGDGVNLRTLKDNGVDHLAIISHDWQRFGYDVRLPDHLPPNPAYGGEAGMIEFGKAANECGYVWSLHENYIDLYPDAPSYDGTARVLRADGSPSPAWFNAGTGVQSYGLKCDRALGYAQQNAPRIHELFGTTAAYLDVHTCVPPWHQLDHDATAPMAGMSLSKVQNDTALFQYMRDTHEGPLFGEGYQHFHWAGTCDGVEAQVNGGEDHRPFLDLDLLKIHPQMVNHGMGYYERWFRRGYEARFGFDTGTVEQIDEYRAQEIAYGHAGFIGNAQASNVQWIAKEHHMMHPVQRLYGDARVEAVDYEIGGEFVTASIALALDARLRQRIRYDSGLTVYVNWAEQPWEIEGRTLPQWGVLALGPDTEVRTSLEDGAIADYAKCPEYVFADARTSFNMPYATGRATIEPALADFRYLGDRRIRVTYEWRADGTVDPDYSVFVHFTNPQVDQGDHIVFQQDHAPPRPTSTWLKGDVITDGPYEIEIPDLPYDTYDLVIGLHQGGRLPLNGLQAGGDRILLARLEIDREGTVVTNIRLGDLAAAAADEVPRADFSANMNPEGTWIDFGPLATDGSVKVERGEDTLAVLPYPRDREFGVELDLEQLVPGLPGEDIEVRALRAMTGEDMGPVEHQAAEGRIRFSVGLAGAGRYVVRAR